MKKYSLSLVALGLLVMCLFPACHIVSPLEAALADTTASNARAKNAAVQKIALFVGLNPSTAARALSRNDLSPDQFVREYESVWGDDKLIDPLAVLSSRLRLSNGKRMRRVQA